ncbi:Hypothetical protein A7982_10970 [Minicystis rosea]|nr:Hypothetical protein A7982_10970 [Minicystis rosea]
MEEMTIGPRRPGRDEAERSSSRSRARRGRRGDGASRRCRLAMDAAARRAFGDHWGMAARAHLP